MRNIAKRFARTMLQGFIVMGACIVLALTLSLCGAQPPAPQPPPRFPQPLPQPGMVQVLADNMRATITVGKSVTIYVADPGRVHPRLDKMSGEEVIVIDDTPVAPKKP